VKGKAWVIADNAEIPFVRQRDCDWIILKTSMAVVGTARSGKAIPKKMSSVICPPFMIAATDRKSALKEITAKWNEAFDAWMESRKGDGI
jgi:hypothetical protein